jgi:hypothetical protein
VVEFVDEVRGGIAAGDCKKVVWLGIEAELVTGAREDEAEDWAAMTGVSLWAGRLKCSMGAVKGSGRLIAALPKVKKPSLVVSRWGRVSGVGAGDDMRFRLQQSSPLNRQPEG